MVLDLLNKVFGRDTGSKDVAKERLRLVLVHDRSSMQGDRPRLSPEILENLKNDLIRVISQYMEIDQDGFDVNLQSSDNQVALVANIPVLAAKKGRER